MIKPTLCPLAFLTLMIAATVSAAPFSWKTKLARELPLLGHRNWIVVADAAYPLQTAPGVETICVEDDQLEVVKAVLAALAQTKHVKPTIYVDAELKHVAETNAPGIGAYRDGLARILEGKAPQALPHEQIIARLDAAGKAFKVLILKTPLTKPYTSVFFQLECGYWNAASEQELRAAMKQAEDKK
jgi:hypothetical protein